jgi:hypothetical protein
MPSEKMTMIAINWSLAKCSCPSWSANTDESALRRSLASLEDCSSSLHWWLGFWTFLVALGVALEVIFVVWEYLDELHDFRRGVIHAPERPQTVLFLLGLLGAGLVAAGVSGEFWKESQIATVETCIRKGNDALFLLLSKEAGDAAASAKTAHEEANAVTGIADEARADAKDALVKAQAAQGSLAQAESDAAKAQAVSSNAASKATKAESEIADALRQANGVSKKVEDAKNNLAILQSLVSARHIIDLKPFEKMKQLKGKQVALFSQWPGDEEPREFCLSLAAALQSPAVGMNATAGCGGLEGPFSPGVLVTGPDFSDSQVLAAAIRDATGASVVAAPNDPKNARSQLTVFVGAKNPFWIGK